MDLSLSQFPKSFLEKTNEKTMEEATDKKLGEMSDKSLD